MLKFKPVTWDNPNKMHIESDYQKFNIQCELVTTGNVSSTCQYSSYIRPYSEIKNGGYIGKQGQFLKFDLQLFYNIPSNIRDILYDKSRKESYILYKFRTWNGNEEDVFGYVLTDSKNNFITESLIVPYGGNRKKRLSALTECKNYICAGFYK